MVIKSMEHPSRYTAAPSPRVSDLLNWISSSIDLELLSPDELFQFNQEFVKIWNNKQNQDCSTYLIQILHRLPQFFLYLPDEFIFSFPKCINKRMEKNDRSSAIRLQILYITFFSLLYNTGREKYESYYREVVRNVVNNHNTILLKTNIIVDLPMHTFHSCIHLATELLPTRGFLDGVLYFINNYLHLVNDPANKITIPVNFFAYYLHITYVCLVRLKEGEVNDPLVIVQQVNPVFQRMVRELWQPTSNTINTFYVLVLYEWILCR